MSLQPFDKHEADVAALLQCGDELLARSAEAINNGEITRQAYQPAIANWRGIAAPEMAAACKPVERGAKTGQLVAAWQAAAAQYWGKQVEGFNRQVDAILASLGRQAVENYGATGTGGAPPTVGQIDEARGAATAAARQQWMQAHAVYIEDGRTRLASILQRGPTEQNLEALREAGVLPGHGFNPGPDILESLKGLVLPAAYLGSAGAWAVGGQQGLLALDAVTTYMGYVRYGEFRPMGYRNPNRAFGFLSPRRAQWYARTWGGNWAAKPGKSGARSVWLRAGKAIPVAGGAVTAGTSAYDQWSRDSGRPDLSTGEKVARAGTRGTIVGFSSGVGSFAGGVAGLAGGPVGAVAGGVVGGAVGQGVGEELADPSVDWIEDRMDDFSGDDDSSG